MLKNEKGFSLAEIMVAAGLLGVVSLGVIKLTQNISKTQNFAHSKSDEIELRTSIRMLLDDERYCRVSLAGDGALGSPSTPVTFNKEDIDEETEGLNISLYISNQEGDARGLKKLNGSNNPGANNKSKFGKLTIKSMKLIMNNGIGANYADSSGHKDLGIIRVVYDKKISVDNIRELTMDFDINVSMSTGQAPEGSGESRIISCSRKSEDIWNRSTVNSDNVYYDQGSVGIGTDDPRVKLDVNGAIKIANTDLACSEDIEGAFKFDATSKKVKVCDGSSWLILATMSPYVWVDTISLTESHAATCARVGASVATDQGYGICAAGESRPSLNEGRNPFEITYRFGTWGGNSQGGQPVGNYCYRSGQTRDNDATDRRVAWLCLDE
jgi:type II secretory pathway pseudopilin PulG